MLIYAKLIQPTIFYHLDRMGKEGRGHIWGNKFCLIFN